MSELRIRVASTLGDVPAEAWDPLVSPDDPFMTHAFLHALEASGSVGGDSGWLPAHVLAYRGTTLVGGAPAYVKNNSYGEYIFDWAWANGAHRAKLPYYPKVVCAVPFTPVTGRRLLVASGEDEVQVTGVLLRGLQHVARACRASSIHLLFLTEAEQSLAAASGAYLPRLTHQYHWSNRGWADFDAYLADFRASARKQVRRERREAQVADVEMKTLRGDDLSPEQWRSLRRFYMSTIRDKGAIAYLTSEFFQRLQTHLAPMVVAELAQRDGVPVAGALCFQRGSHLYGRYWGATEECPFLHFELCYYRPIEHAIRRGYTRFEAGAQGEHKIKRGLLPHPTFSAHWFEHVELARAVADYVAREAEATTAEMEVLTERGPFRREAFSSMASEVESDG